MADGEDLVSEVKVNGIDQAIAAWNAFQKAGVDAYIKIGAASKAFADLSKGAFSGVQKGIKELQALTPKPGQVGSWQNLTGAIGQTVKGLNQLQRVAPGAVERVKRLGLVTVGAGAGFLAFARSVSQSLDTAGKSTESFADEQVRAMQRSQQFQSAQFGFRQSVQSLDRAFNEGKITFTEYNDQLRELQFSYKQTQASIRFTQNQEESLRLETERLQAAAAKQKAFDELITKFGGPLTGSLVSAGRAVGQFLTILQQTLGPALGSLIDRMTQSFDRNRTQIVGFFQTIGEAIQGFVDRGGVESTISFLGDVFRVLGDIMTNAVIPAFKAIKTVADGAAAAINKVFGTQLTGGVLLAVLGIGAFLRVFRYLIALFNIVSGASKGLINVLFAMPSAFKAIGLAIKTIGVGLTSLNSGFGAFVANRARVLLLAASFTDLGAKAIAVAQLIPGLFASMGAAIVTALRTPLATAARLLSTVFSGGILTNALSFARVLPLIATGFRLVFAALGPIGLAFTAISIAIALLEANGISVKDLLVRAAAVIVTAAQSILDAWKSVQKLFSDGWAAAVAYVSELFNQLLAFFAGLPGQFGAIVQAVADAIKAGFKGAYDYVAGLFTDLLSWAKSKLQPIIDMLRLIKSLGGSVGGAEASTGGQFAGGGSVSGPGTTTSDSIPAWLSRGEFVMRAKAVARYGSAFMHAINRGQLNLSDIAGFAMGGHVGSRFAYAPKFADGGDVGGMRPLQFVLPDGSTANAQSSDGEAKKLVRYAVAKQARSAGRKASWVGKR